MIRCAVSSSAEQYPVAAGTKAALCTFVCAGDSPYVVYAGKECARAIAKDSTAAADCSADLSGCSEKELQRLQQKLQHIKETYDEVGKVSTMVLLARSAAVGCIIGIMAVNSHGWGVSVWTALSKGAAAQGCQ
jgi:hypothetical protein